MHQSLQFRLMCQGVVGEQVCHLQRRKKKIQKKQFFLGEDLAKIDQLHKIPLHTWISLRNQSSLKRKSWSQAQRPWMRILMQINQRMFQKNSLTNKRQPRKDKRPVACFKCLDKPSLSKASPPNQQWSQNRTIKLPLNLMTIQCLKNLIMKVLKITISLLFLLKLSL